MNQKILIYYANKYSFKNESTNQVVEGVTINYLTNVELNQVQKSESTRGSKHAKATLPLSDMDKLTVVPGIYNAVFELDADSSGALVAKVCDVALDSGVHVEAVPFKK